MILRELFEVKAKAKSVGIIFGRFNPPHMGHMKAWEMASENSTWYVGTNKSKAMGLFDDGKYYSTNRNKKS